MNLAARNELSTATNCKTVRHKGCELQQSLQRDRPSEVADPSQKIQACMAVPAKCSETKLFDQWAEVLGKREGVVHRLATLKTLPAYQQLPRQPSRSQRRRDALHFLRSGVLGTPPFCALMPPTLFREFSFLWQLGRFLFGLPAREL